MEMVQHPLDRRLDRRRKQVRQHRPWTIATAMIGTITSHSRGPQIDQGGVLSFVTGP